VTVAAPLRRRARIGVNAVVVATGLLVALPLVAIAERLRAGAGRRVAVGAIRAIAASCGVRVLIDDPGEDVDGPTILVPNHGSPVDIAAVLLARPDVRFAAAKELFDIPVLRIAMRALDTVPVDRERPSVALRRLGDAVRDAPGLRLVVFPEGGMAPAGAPLRFKTGPFSLAIEAGAVVVPVAISGAATVLPRGSRFAVRPGTVSIRVLPALRPEGTTASDRRALRDHAQAAVARALDEAG
jgi:putative phosphoserine phosphatase/1-acylglycerol-3-phosphate O-acyltransferase